MRTLGFYVGGSVWFIFLILLVIYLKSKDKKFLNIFSKSVAIYLITFKVIETIIKVSQKEVRYIPVDYSTVMYYLISVTILFNISKIKKFAAFGSFVAGVGYLSTFIFIHSLYDTFTTYDLIVSSINHGILFVLSSIIMFEVTLCSKDIKTNLIYSTILFLYSFSMWNLIDFSNEGLFIYELMFGRIVGINKIKNIILFHIVNLGTVYILFTVLNGLFIFINTKIYNRKKIA